MQVWPYSGYGNRNMELPWHMSTVNHKLPLETQNTKKQRATLVSHPHQCDSIGRVATFGLAGNGNLSPAKATHYNIV